MWTSYRQCQLHLTNLLSRLNRSLSSNPEAFIRSREHTKTSNEIQTLTDDICASIPFLLVGEGIHGNKPIGSIWFQRRPPMLMGGLNLQWALFTVSILELVPLATRRNMKDLLLWIGKNLGIGQATVLAQVCVLNPSMFCQTQIRQMDKNPTGGVTAKGDALRWAGFFV